jgi:hypothetical protein
MRNPADLAPTKLAADVPPDPLQADGLHEARNEATEAIAARGALGMVLSLLTQAVSQAR